MEKLSFYDLKAKKKFMSDKYTVKTKNGMRYALTISPSGSKSARILGRTKSMKKSKKR